MKKTAGQFIRKDSKIGIERETKIMVMRVGGASYREIGNCVGLSGQRVQQIIWKAIGSRTSRLKVNCDSWHELWGG